MDRIIHYRGMPKSASYLIHLWQKRTCNRVGHTPSDPYVAPICTRCRQVVENRAAQ